MLTGDQIDALPMALESAFHRLQGRITDDIVRRMKANMGEVTRAADWQLYRARELGASKREIRRIIADTLKLAEGEVDKIYDAAVNSGYARSVEIYEKTGIDVRAYKDNDVLKQLVTALKSQTLDELYNITGTLGVATVNKGTRQIISLTQFYTQTLDDAALDIVSGAFDYNTVLKRTVRELTNSGIRRIYYDSVTKRPTSARVEVAARRAVMTGVSQVTGKISEQNAEALGTDMYEVSVHGGARPDHLTWQGGWYSMADLRRVCGYGDVTGLKGANCRHDFYPVIPGIDEPSYTADELAKIREDELTPRTYNGKEYTKYEATQRQRELERTMRARRESIKALTDGGADEDDIIKERVSYRAVSQEYTRFSKAMGLREQRERVMIDGLGTVGTGKFKADLTNKDYSDIMYMRGKMSNVDARKWYLAHDKKIPELIDKSLSVEEQARQACELRNKFRTQARELMADQEKRRELDITDPNVSFEQLIERKMKKKNMTREQAIKDILKTATKTRASVNRELGLEE